MENHQNRPLIKNQVFHPRRLNGGNFRQIAFRPETHQNEILNEKYPFPPFSTSSVENPPTYLFRNYIILNLNYIIFLEILENVNFDQLSQWVKLQLKYVT